MSNIIDIILYGLGLLIGAVLDVATFCSIVAIPLAALLIIGIISKQIAIVVLIIVAFIATLRVLLIGILQKL